jgi:hypothetical protein
MCVNRRRCALGSQAATSARLYAVMRGCGIPRTGDAREIIRKEREPLCGDERLDGVGRRLAGVALRPRRSRGRQCRSAEASRVRCVDPPRPLRGWRIYVGGRSPDKRVNMKVLWSARRLTSRAGASGLCTRTKIPSSDEQVAGGRGDPNFRDPLLAVGEPQWQAVRS